MKMNNVFAQTMPSPTQDRNFVLSGRQLFSGGHAEEIGLRSSMEDACAIIGEFAGAGTQFYGVFDGHGGNEVSLYCANNLHRVISRTLKDEDITVEKAIINSIEEVNKGASSKYPNTGSTAAIVMVVNNIVYCANVGDTRILLVENGKTTRCSYDHKASDPAERQLVLARGGQIVQNRVNGVLMLSRAIGDRVVGPGLSCEPFIKRMRRKDGMRIVIACDGVFDVVDDETVGSLATRHSNTQEAARVIKDLAISRGTTDNVTCIVINLTPK
ncbi:Protein phosphatase 2C 1 [Tritrichomonas foetus]|uniref:Protein phosphatase 2C 1 n=1 Tax=Tritrichomonas foetus TaxID=1144522 RepID=A0A1J4KA26_9EUKA|nr:Protein phosphatase 2C 1 [Tritrichomonas foetus]|eukprot:OHT07810.1 Protein phosphatase 2C 1 [Tritrichomonas foetus]